MKHNWMLEDGDPIIVTDHHYGPFCRRCYQGWCVGCEPERSLDEECPGDEYEMPNQFDLLTGEVVQ